MLTTLTKDCTDEYDILFWCQVSVNDTDGNKLGSQDSPTHLSANFSLWGKNLCKFCHVCIRGVANIARMGHCRNDPQTDADRAKEILWFVKDCVLKKWSKFPKWCLPRRSLWSLTQSTMGCGGTVACMAPSPAILEK